MSTSPVPLSQINFLPLRAPGSPFALMVGGSVAGSLLSTMTGNPLATLVSEAIANLQSSIDTINRVVSQPPVLQSLTLNSADIGTLNVASQYGPGQLSVFQGPPSFPLIGWVGSESAPYQSPTTTITSTTAGVVTTSSAHGLQVNQVVQMLGTTNPVQNQIWVVATTPLTTTFTVTGFSGSSTGGTVQRVLVGGWFKTLAVGGTSYLNAFTNGLFADENGNLTVNALTVKGAMTGTTLSLNANGTTTTINNNTGTSGQAAGLVVQDNATTWKTEVTPFGYYLFNASGVARAEMIKTSSDSGFFALFGNSATHQMTIDPGVPKMTMDGNQVVTVRQTGPGNPSFAVLGDAQTWCSNLLTALRTHGLVT